MTVRDRIRHRLSSVAGRNPPRALLLGSVALALGHAAEAQVPAPPSSSSPLAVCRGVDGYAAQGARTFLWRPEWLAAQKAAVAVDPRHRARLVRAADAALLRGPYSVTDKGQAPEGGTPNDYLSIGPYWWPDHSKPNGKPYRRRDGEVNPERSGDRFDATRSDRFSSDVETLALAWHMTGDRRYADHAAGLIRTWFLDPAKRMNPSLDHAQAVPGVSAGRAEGVLDATRLIPVIESIGLIEGSGALTPVERGRVEAWFADLAQWMATSPNGKAERAARNNHGIYFDMLLSHFALFARMEGVTQRLAAEFGVRRLAQQIDAQGTLPAETARTRSWHYSAFTLQAAVQMAMLGECVGRDLWGWSTSAGRSLRKAIDYLHGYRATLDRWPYRDIDLADPKRRQRALGVADTLFRTAAWGYRDPTLQPAGDQPASLPYWYAPLPADR